MIPKLAVELVPKTCWFTNVRSNVSKADWDRLKKITAGAADNRCEICNGIGPKWPVECHEIWHYDDQAHVQTLVRLQALCPSCHEVKHVGLAQVRGRMRHAIGHLQTVNGWDLDQTASHIAQAFNRWAERSCHEWTLDISWLEHLGIQPGVPLGTATRSGQP